MKYLNLLFLSIFSLSTAFADSSESFDDPTCDNICGQLVDQSSDKQVGITGTDGWTSSDIAWCAANPYSAAYPPHSSALATQYNRCQYNNTTVLTYCEAYEKTRKAQGMEIPLLVLDVVGAGFCGTACALGYMPGAVGIMVNAACRTDSTAASALDVYDALILQSDPTARALTGVMGAAGIGTNTLSLVENQADGNSIKDYFSGNSVGQHDQRNACITAGVLAAGAGMRAWDLTHQQQSKESACNAVKSLLSNSPVIGAVNTTTGTSTAQSGSSGNNSAGSSATRTSSSITGSGANMLESQIACVANGGMSQCGFANPGQSSAATDGGLLSSSGLGQTVAQQLGSNLPAISSSPDAAALIKSAMGDGASGDIATKIADVAKVAQEDGQKLAQASGGYSGGSAVAASAPKAAPAFGGFNFDSPAAAEKKEVSFERAPASSPDGDIWHTGFQGSIFQIVSLKIVETKPRVDHLDWTTPLNRALMGLPNLKTAGEKK